MTNKKEHAVYYVGLKILLSNKEGKVLMLKSHSNTGGKFWDLPGGRINKAEHKTPLAKIIAREVAEEIGKKISFDWGNRCFNSAGISKKEISMFSSRSIGLIISRGRYRYQTSTPAANGLT